MSLVDPWRDAAQLAHRLQSPNAVLVVVLGAQAWCQKCRDIFPLVQEYAQAAPEKICLWLDIEEHQEFIGDYLPEDLPVLAVWQGPQLIILQSVTASSFGPTLQEISTSFAGTNDPGIRARLLQENWAR